MQPHPRSPDLVWPGHLHGTGCLSARAVGTRFPTVVRHLCLGPGCGWVWVLLTPPVLAGVFGGRVWARFVVLSLFCRLFGVFVVGLRFWPAYGTCVVSCALRLPPAASGCGVRCGRACWARVSTVLRLSWLGCRGVFFALFFVSFCFVVLVAGCPRPGPCGPPIPFLSGRAARSFFFRGVCLHVSVSLFPDGRCSWLCVAGFGWMVPLCLFGGPVFGAFWVGGLAASCGVGRRFGGCGVFSRPPASPPLFFFWGGGLPVPPSAFPALAEALARIYCGLPGCCWQLRCVWPCSGPMGLVGYVHVGLGAPSCWVRSWLCQLGGYASRLRVAPGWGAGIVRVLSPLRCRF